MNILDDLKERQQRLAARQAAESVRMKQDGSHMLSGAPYKNSSHGSWILRKYIERQQAAALSRLGMK